MLLPIPVAVDIVKFVFDISKNIFPTAFTFILAVVEFTLGRVTCWLPSFAVPLTNTVGKVFPPSVDKRISTVAQLTVAAFVFATFHVTVCG